ncbi:MAG: indolepyruvate ferredoxin oxidoreductase [Bacteroidetes bacterium]|nr:indolepyruvate ferredoxin oxidoreductase [Bacteroidota bacterium]
MHTLLLLGDEAIAQAGIDAGMSGMYAYPGTPSTEIMEFVQGSREAAMKTIHREWSANEKTAMEAALGMSYAGKRAMVAMKHVGLNVAADGFINAAITGVNGGLIVVAADDPSMHSSQNEQDSRFYAKFSFVPVLEPSNQQEAYDMVFAGFEISEKYKVPVMLRITTRLAHSRSGVKRKGERKQNALTLPSDPRQFVLLPAIARRRYHGLLGIYESLRYDETLGSFNQYYEGSDRRLGIISFGISFNYLTENYPDRDVGMPVLKICSYPVDNSLLERIAAGSDELLVLEEGYPVMEELLKGILSGGKSVKGRLDGTLPREGELNPAIVAAALGLPATRGGEVPEIVRMRPPSFCKGCGHADMYNALHEALAGYAPGRVFSDIGCYTLGALPPYNAINSCVDMGASVTMAVGAADAGLVPSVAVIGDSTFTHSGMTGLLDAVIKNSPVTVIISDNSTTGMTGGQQSHATDRLESICEGLGVDRKHIRTIVPLRKNHEENIAIMKEELAYNGVSVIIARRECIQTASRRKKEAVKQTDNK